MDMTTERPTAVHALYDGDLAYYETLFSGLVPVKVLRAENETHVIARVTAERGAYHKGEVMRTPVLHLVHRSAVWRKHSTSGPRILGRTVYMGAQ